MERVVSFTSTEDNYIYVKVDTIVVPVKIPTVHHFIGKESYVHRGFKLFSFGNQVTMLKTFESFSLEIVPYVKRFG